MVRLEPGVNVLALEYAGAYSARLASLRISRSEYECLHIGASVYADNLYPATDAVRLVYNAGRSVYDEREGLRCC